jgi:DNA-binding MarR family transcriptional regulator
MPHTIIRHEREHLYADPPATEPGRALAIALLHLRRAEQAQEIRALTASGLSNLDLQTLRYLVQADRDGRDLTPKSLIGMLGTSSANVTNIVDRLVKKGYVERVNNPTDRRSHHLVPTEAAVQQVRAAIGEHHSTLVSVIDQLDDAQAAVAAAVIERISAALDAREDGRQPAAR